MNVPPSVSDDLLRPAGGRATCEVPAAMLRRHLCVPVEAEWDDAMASRAGGAREWFTRHATPWTLRRGVSIARIGEATIDLDGGARLDSSVLAGALAEAGAHSLVIVAISTGPEVEREIDRLWKAGRPDEAMFLSAWANSVVERLRCREAERLAELAGRQDMTVLPHYSPGYEGWDLNDQRHLYDLIADAGAPMPGPLELLPSGELVPVKSTLAVFAVAATPEPTASAWSRDLRGFWKRRATATLNAAPSPERAAATPPATRSDRPAYAVPERTLEKWASQRLTMTDVRSGRVRARFRFDGTTCSNMGMPLAFDYEVELAREARAYRVLACACGPASSDTGHRSMCGYLEAPEAFLSAIGEAPAWSGRTLDDLLEWTPVTSLSGCLCTRASRDHKWRIVLHTLHYALTREVVPTVE